MFALTDGMHYYLCQHYVDMRKGMTGLYRLVKSDMSLSPVSGDVFVFFSRKRDMVKILRWDTDGFILYQKRLEEGTFEVPRFNPDISSRRPKHEARGRCRGSWRIPAFLSPACSRCKPLRRRSWQEYPEWC